LVVEDVEREAREVVRRVIEQVHSLECRPQRYKYL